MPMRTASHDRSPPRRDNDMRDCWTIALELPWCVIRIELPQRQLEATVARRRSPAMAEPSPRAAARPAHWTCYPKA